MGVPTDTTVPAGGWVVHPVALRGPWYPATVSPAAMSRCSAPARPSFPSAGTVAGAPFDTTTVIGLPGCRVVVDDGDVEITLPAWTVREYARSTTGWKPAVRSALRAWRPA